MQLGGHRGAGGVTVSSRNEF